MLITDSVTFQNIQDQILALPDKLNFKIGEVAKILGVQTHVLRYWEEEFPLLKPKKFINNQRLYFKRDLEILFLIKFLLYEERLTVNGAKKHLTRCYHQFNENKSEREQKHNQHAYSKIQKDLESLLGDISSLKSKVDKDFI